MPVHAHSAPVQQEQPRRPRVGRAIYGPDDCRRQRHQYDLAALAAHPQHTVTVLLAQIVDVRARRLEDAEPEEPEQAHEREVEGVVRLPRGAEHGLELQMRQPERRRFRRDVRPTDVLGR